MTTQRWFRTSFLALVSLVVSIALLAGCSAPSQGGSSGSSSSPTAAPKPAATTAAAPSGQAAPTAQAAAPAGPAKIVRIGDTITEDNPEYPAHQFFGKRLSELTKGGYEVKIFPNSVLGGHTQMNEQLASGALEMAKSGSGFMSTYDKKFSIFSLPYLYGSEEKLFAAQDGKLGQAYADLAAKYGLKVLGFYYSGTRNMYNRKVAINTPDDLKKNNIRLRSQPDPVMLDSFNTLGAQATPMEAGEVYNGIQQGVIDGAENSVTWYLTQKHFEVAPYFSKTQHLFSVDPFMVSLKWYNSLPADVQSAIVQAAKETIPYERKIWDEGDAKNFEKAKASGVKLNEADIPSFQKAAKPLWDKYGPDFGEFMDIVKAGQ